MTTHRSAAALVGVAIILLAASANAGVILITQTKANAGNITPGDSAGFPVTLSQSGSYRLDSTLTVPAGKNGIVINAAGVTLDLNGFTLASGGKTTNGVFGASDNATIENGTISGFQKDGIHSSGGGWIVQNMRVTGSKEDGVYLNDFGRITGNVITHNGKNGIECDSCLILNNAVSSNGSVGILAPSATILGNSIVGNTSYGINGGFTGGFGDNTLILNNGGGNPQVTDLNKMDPNYCFPPC